MLAPFPVAVRLYYTPGTGHKDESGVYGLRSSVRYWGASASDFARNAACAASSSSGAGVVLVATGTPTAWKNSSCPAGEQVQSSRTSLSVALVNECGAFAGDVCGLSGPHNGFLAAEGDLYLAIENRKRLLEIVPMGRRAAARWNQHVDHAVATGGVLACQKKSCRYRPRFPRWGNVWSVSGRARVKFR